MGISSGGIVLTQLTAFLLKNYDWRTAWVVLGVLVLVVIVPLSLLLMRRQPEDLGLRPDGDPPPASATRTIDPPAPQRRSWRLPFPRPRQVEERDWTLGEAARTPALWLLVIAVNLSGLAMSTLTLHQVPLLQDRGLSVATAATVVTLFAVGSLTAKVLWGLASEFVPLRYLAALNFAGASLSIGILFNVHSAAAAFIYGGVAGFTMGAMPVVQNLLWPAYFGRASLGTIRGAVMPVGALATGFGPYLGGAVYDATRSYSLVLLALIVATASASLLMLLSRPPRAPEGM
jgi:sugar phosphate permease